MTPPAETADAIPDPTTIDSARDVNYIGIGGRYKASASLQLNLPLPLGPQWGANVFLDGGQVFSPSVAPTAGLLRAGGTPADSSLADVLEDEVGIRFGAGAGIQYLTPVGFVSVGFGLKLNPSYLDLRSPARVYCGDSINDADPVVCFGGDEVNVPGSDADFGYIDARLSGRDFVPDDIDEGNFFRRLQLHLSIGQTF